MTKPQELLLHAPLPGAGMKFVRRYSSILAVWLLVVLLAVGASLTSPDFLTSYNLSTFLESIGILSCLALAQSFVLLVAGIDLSVGAGVALGSVVIALLLDAGTAPWLAIAACVALLTVAGVLNGLAVTRLRIPSFIVTFAMLGVEEGLALWMSGGDRISLPAASNFGALDSGSFAGLPPEIWLVLAITVLGTLGLRYLRLGRYLYAVGSNREATRVAGVNVVLVLIMAFAICGFLTGIAGWVYTARIVSGNPLVESELNLQSIAAAVIGGVSLFGGQGSLVGALGGVLIYSLINNVLNLFGLNPDITEVVQGLLIVGAVYLNEVQRRAALAGRAST